jgi:hypothetical protein
MLVGHVGIALGARALDRREEDARAPLFWLLAASFAPDILDGVYSAVRFCNPQSVFSHSLPAVAMLAVLFGGLAALHTRSIATALLVAGLVVLHLPADYVTGHKALWVGGPVVGLNVYRWEWLDLLVELPLIVVGWWLLRRTRFTPRWAVSGFALVAMLGVQASFGIANKLIAPSIHWTCKR